MTDVKLADILALIERAFKSLTTPQKRQPRLVPVPVRTNHPERYRRRR